MLRNIKKRELVSELKGSRRSSHRKPRGSREGSKESKEGRKEGKEGRREGKEGSPKVLLQNMVRAVSVRLAPVYHHLLEKNENGNKQ